MKTPPFLLLAVLLFWGWQSGLFLAGMVMGVALESTWFVKARWELSDTDFRRILTFCTVLALTMAVYAFTANETGGSFGEPFHGPAAARNMSLTGMRASTAFFRWLPMALFAFAVAQAFSTREKIPWTAISAYSRWRARQDQARDRIPAGGGVNVSYPYFMVCLFSAGIHARPGSGAPGFFLGQCGLVIWALWPFRSRRFGVSVWAVTLAAALAFGFLGQRGISRLQLYVEGYNAKWLSYFVRPQTDPLKSETAIGQIGKLELSGRIVIRLHTENHQPPPTYLREASYRTYHSSREEWYAGTRRSDFELVSPETNQTTWVLLPAKTNTALVNIACYLNGTSPELHNPEGLLPLPTGCSRLDHLYAYLLRKNSEGAVLAEGPGLVIFDARYGPGATIDSPPDTSSNRLDLAVPADEVPALRQVISEMKVPGRSEAQTLETVYGFFQSHFTYSLWQGPNKLATTNETPLARFLLTSRSGHCEYFATATVLLLRELKIPARYAVGYYVHEKSGRGYVVRERDAHAWCLVWNKQAKTWENFDTTPASWVRNEDKRASAFQWLMDFRSWLGFEISKLRWGQTRLRDYILWGLVPVLLLLLYQILFRRGWQRQPKRRAKEADVAVFWPGLDSEFYLLETQLARHGVTRRPGEPLSGWLARILEDPALADLRVPLGQLLQLHYRHRFDPRGLSDEERNKLTQEAKAVLNALSKMQTSGKVLEPARGDSNR